MSTASSRASNSLAARHRPDGVFPLQGFHVELLAVVSDNKALLLRAEITSVQLFADGFFFLRRPCSPLLLNFLDAPLLLLVESTFSHIVGRLIPAGKW